MRRLRHIALCTASTSLLFACGSDHGQPHEPPASVDRIMKEAGLNTVTLTDKAIERLGITTAAVERRSVGDSRLVAGEVIAMPSRTVTLTAPMAGTVLDAKPGEPLTAGRNVRRGQRLFRLLILPSERDLLSAREDVAQKQVQYDVVVEKVHRAEQLLKERAGSVRAKQEADAELAGVTASLRVAQARLELLRGHPNGDLADRLSTLDVEAPIEGMIQRVFIGSSQVVATAAPILELTSTSTLWVRVPVYAGDADRIDRMANAYIQSLSGDSPEHPSIAARPVNGPMTADLVATSVDLYYEIDNRNGRFRPGQRIGALIPRQGRQSSLVIAFSAVLYDPSGGTWIYERTGDRTFVRRRVEVDHVEDGMVVLRRGLTEGTRVVTTGAAELFGTEFGGGK